MDIKRKTRSSGNLPRWFKKPIYTGKNLKKTAGILKKKKLNTICIEGKCPNKGECFSNREVTFMINGNKCTRNCFYCNVDNLNYSTGTTESIDLNEPVNIANAVKELNLKYVVITSVTRDDLDDGGVEGFINTVNEIKKINPKTKVELLIPDFKGKEKIISEICSSKADVIGHNIEVAGRRLFKELRPMGDYDTSLKVLNQISKQRELSKSGFMLGFGETMPDIENTINELYNEGVKILTIGQYLAPNKTSFKVKKYYTPDEFSEIQNLAKEIGIKHVKAGPFVRSSYHAGDLFE